MHACPSIPDLENMFSLWLKRQVFASWGGVITLNWPIFCFLFCYCSVIMPWCDFYELEWWFSWTICTHSWFLSSESSSQFVDVSARKSHPVVSRSGMWSKETILSLHFQQACSQDFQCHYMKVGVISCARSQLVYATSADTWLAPFRHWCMDADYMLNQDVPPPVGRANIRSK